MRLTDADELIKDRVENDPVRIAAACAPTAFDKEKVIEDLKKFSNNPCTLHECGVLSEYCSVCMAKKAIDIVEKGGM